MITSVVFEITKKCIIKNVLINVLTSIYGKLKYALMSFQMIDFYTTIKIRIKYIYTSKYIY